MISNDAACAIIARVPGWQNAEVENLRALEGGLTNQSFVFEINAGLFVLRVNGENSQSIGINREAEFAAMREASCAGFAPEIIHFFPSEGHLVRRFNPGHEWNSQEIAQPENMRRALQTLSRVHALGRIDFEFSPFRDVEHRLQSARELGLALPDDVPELLHHATEIERNYWRIPAVDIGLCHNDPFANNFIVSENGVQLIDWEFAGMGDVFYDIACLTVYYPAAKYSDMLEWYFGEPRLDAREKLQAIKWVMDLWNWTWAVLQAHSAGAQQRHREIEKTLLGVVRSGIANKKERQQ